MTNIENEKRWGGRILKRKWMSSMVVGIVWISSGIPAAQAEVNPIADARSASSDKQNQSLRQVLMEKRLYLMKRQKRSPQEFN